MQTVKTTQEKFFTKSRIDPRVKLFHILLAGTVIVMLRTSIANAAQILLLAGFLAYLGFPAASIKLAAYYTLLTITYRALLLFDHYQICFALSMLVFILRRFAPVLGVYYLFSKAMTVGEYLDALEKIGLPRTFTIPMAVALRFLPTIGREVGMIKDSLRMRNRPLSVTSILRSPFEMMEYVFIPLTIRCIKIADELSASAVARGIENPVRRTSGQELKINRADIIYFAVVVLAYLSLVLYDIFIMR